MPNKNNPIATTDISTSVVSGSSNLITSGAVYTAINSIPTGSSTSTLVASSDTKLSGAKANAAGYGNYTPLIDPLNTFSTTTTLTIPAGFSKVCFIIENAYCAESIWTRPTFSIQKNGTSVFSFEYDEAPSQYISYVSHSFGASCTPGEQFSFYGTAPYGGSSERTLMHFRSLIVILC